MVFNRKPKPEGPVTKPTGGDPDDDFPDDVIPSTGNGGRVVATVRLKLARIQLNKQRFPEAYADGQNGLVPNPGSYEGGSESIPYGSKIWLDLTAKDAEGREWLRGDILEAKLGFKTEHHCGGAFIKGKGQDAQGNPNPGYEVNEAKGVGNGITAWLSSKGFLHQMKVNQEGEFDCVGFVDGVESNSFTIRVD